MHEIQFDGYRHVQMEMLCRRAMYLPIEAIAQNLVWQRSRNCWWMMMHNEESYPLATWKFHTECGPGSQIMSRTERA
jgi:hypothetical protein